MVDKADPKYRDDTWRHDVKESQAFAAPGVARLVPSRRRSSGRLMARFTIPSPGSLHHPPRKRSH